MDTGRLRRIGLVMVIALILARCGGSPLPVPDAPSTPGDELGIVERAREVADDAEDRYAELDQP